MILIGNVPNRVITINEEQSRCLLESLKNEGGVFKNGGSMGLVNLTMDNNDDDYSNRQFDNRRIVNKNIALNGDGTLSANSKSFKDKYLDAINRQKYYASIVRMLESLPQGVKLTINDIYREGTSRDVVWKNYRQIRNVYKILNTEEGQLLYNDMLDKAYKNMHNAENIVNGFKERYDRLTNDDGNDTTLGYYSGTVVGTDIDVKTGQLSGTGIKYIALYYMSDFNFSDAMKHGELRQNGNAMKLAQQEFKVKDPSYRIQLTYDNNVQPNVRDNFSLDKNDKYTPQSNPTSVTKFIDDTLQYAEEVMKNVGFTPSFIVCASSSSKYNHYFCSRLSQQMNVPYLTDFFKRNIVNVKFENGKDLREMLKYAHLSEREISETVSACLRMAMTEASFLIRTPLNSLIQKYSQILLQIPSEDNNSTISLDDIVKTYSNYIFSHIANQLSQGDELEIYLLKQCIRNSGYKFTKKEQYIYNAVQNYTANSKFSYELEGVIEEMAKLAFRYKEQIKSKNGYKLSTSYEKFKITKCPQNARKFLQGKNLYVVADEYVDENLKLNKQYENGNFLIFDEDINSGATLMLTVDALRNSLPDTSDSNILCLCTAYSTSGN